MSETKNERTCTACAGCGQVANDDDRTPWRYWAELPVQSALAVTLGLVRPLQCSECGGTGTPANPSRLSPSSDLSGGV
jgi:hypothetical protein